MKDVPIFINSRDRLSCLKGLLNWLESAGHNNITIIDNASTYSPLREFLQSSLHKVIRLSNNEGHTALWKLEAVQQVIGKEYFVWTDPDVIPCEFVPQDAVLFFRDLLQRYPSFVKAGFGLRFDDLPDHYHLKQEVVSWERSLYSHQIEKGVYEAPIDTTFALYRPGTPYCHGPALRTSGVYCARHVPWYLNSLSLDYEELYYRKNALADITHWNVSGKVPRITIDHERGGVGVCPQFGQREVTAHQDR